MIRTTRTVVAGDTASTINLPIILYRGDRGIEVLFEINSKFRFVEGVNLIESSNASFGQLIIKNDYVSIISKINACNNGRVALTITSDMTDELNELGTYAFQIRLFDGSLESRITLPPVYEGIEIREAIETLDDIALYKLQYDHTPLPSVTINGLFAEEMSMRSAYYEDYDRDDVSIEEDFDE